MTSRRLASTLLLALPMGCGSAPPCEPKVCLERANALDYGRGDREETLTYLERACDGGLPIPCVRYATIIGDHHLAAAHGKTATRLLVHGCRDLRSGLACLQLAAENHDDMALIDEGCSLGEARACGQAAYLRSQSREKSDLQRALPYYQAACNGGSSDCTTLARLQDSLGDTEGAASTRAGICEAKGGPECTHPAFNAAVGRGRSVDFDEARRLARKTCPPTPPGLENFGNPPECEALAEVDGYLKREAGTTLALVTKTTDGDRVELAVPSGFALAVGSHISRGLPNLIINSSTTFEARVVESAPGRLVVIHEPMVTPSMSIKVGVSPGTLLLIRFASDTSSAPGAAKAAGAPVTVTVHGTVHDYAGRPVANASVRGTAGERAVSVQTNKDGRFDIVVGAGTPLSASEGDLYGSITLGTQREQTLVIRLAQMPM